MAAVSLAFLVVSALSFGGLLLAAILSYVNQQRLRQKYRNLPKGPAWWPVVGYWGLIGSLDKLRKEVFTRLPRKYGGMVGLHIGSRYCVIIDDFQAIKESHNREEFLGRPDGTFRGWHNLTNIIDMSGTMWKEHRKFQMNSFRSSGVGSDALVDSVLAQVSVVKTELQDSTQKDVNINHLVELPLNNAIFHIIFGQTFDSKHPMIEFLTEYDIVMDVNLMFDGFFVFFPWARPLLYFNSWMRKIVRYQKKMDKIVRDEIDQHRSTLNREDPRDYIDRFLIRMTDGDPAFTDDILMENIKALLHAGSDTTRITLVWILLCAAAFPEEQDKVQEEIDSVLGREKEPRLKDKSDLPCTDAFIMETMRWKNLAVLNLLRSTTSDTELLGYDIPKDTVLLTNMTSVSHDPKNWSHPEQFYPRHFLNKDGTQVVVPESHMPFGYGRRTCSGEKMASTALFLFAVSILQRFRVLPPDGGVNLDTAVDFSNKAAHPYLRFKVRD